MYFLRIRVCSCAYPLFVRIYLYLCSLLYPYFLNQFEIDNLKLLLGLLGTYTIIS